MSQADWLTLNTQRAYPFTEPVNLTGSSASLGLPIGNEIFADLGFTAGVSSYFEPGRDSVYLDRYWTDGSIIRFFFRVEYGAGAPYEAMDCYDWVFTFNLTDPIGTVQYAVPTLRPVDVFDYAPETEVPEMGLGFMACGQLDGIVLGAGGEYVLDEPKVEPALIKSDVRSYVNAINVANEERPCPTVCCDSSSSSSPSGESSSSPSSAFCTPEAEPEPALQAAPLRLSLPNGQFTGAVKLMSGYNLQISIIESQTSLKFDAAVNAGDGMQCEDLRIEDDGEPVHDSCETCGTLVYGINGHGYPAESIQLVGAKGVVILPDPDNHRIFVILEEEGLCRVDI